MEQSQQLLMARLTKMNLALELFAPVELTCLPGSLLKGSLFGRSCQSLSSLLMRGLQTPPQPQAIEMLRNIFCWKGFGPVTGPPSFPGANFQQMVIARLSLGLSFFRAAKFPQTMSWWETLHLVTWWKRLGISAIKTGQAAPSWIWCTERLSFFGGGHIVLQRFVHVRCRFQPLPTKLVFAYFDRGSYVINVIVLDGWKWPKAVGRNNSSQRFTHPLLSDTSMNDHHPQIRP